MTAKTTVTTAAEAALKPLSILASLDPREAGPRLDNLLAAVFGDSRAADAARALLANAAAHGAGLATLHLDIDHLRTIRITVTDYAVRYADTTGVDLSPIAAYADLAHTLSAYASTTSVTITTPAPVAA